MSTTRAKAPGTGFSGALAMVDNGWSRGNSRGNFVGIDDKGELIEEAMKQFEMNERRVGAKKELKSEEQRRPEEDTRSGDA